jgi:hypothetical protein
VQKDTAHAAQINGLLNLEEQGMQNVRVINNYSQWFAKAADPFSSL